MAKYDIFPDRIVKAREDKGLTQTKFAQEVDRKIKEANEKAIEEAKAAGKSMEEVELPFKGGFNKTYASQIECGRRETPKKLIPVFCEVLDCTENFLRGKDSSSYDWRDTTCEISIKELYKYDGQPVCLRWNSTGQQYWGIVTKLDATKSNVSVGSEKNERFYSNNLYGVLVSKPEIQVIALTPSKQKEITILLWSRLYTEYSALYKNQLSLQDALHAEKVYVRMRSNDPYVTTMYDGWYKINETHNALINDLGNVLPLAGYGKTYNCYKDGVNLRDN